MRGAFAFACFALLLTHPVTALAQAGSVGGTVGKQDKSVSGGDDNAPSLPRKPAPAEQKRGSGTFDRPTINGARVDWCLQWNGGLGAECGEPAATAFCKIKGFSHDLSWTHEQVPAAYLIGEKTRFDCPLGCTAFVHITCE
jgi:hypothetical protein